MDGADHADLAADRPRVIAVAYAAALPVEVIEPGVLKFAGRVDGACDSNML
jgi:hypothetical protein